MFFGKNIQGRINLVVDTDPVLSPDTTVWELYTFARSTSYRREPIQMGLSISGAP